MLAPGRGCKYTLSSAERSDCTETITNQLLADSYQNPISGDFPGGTVVKGPPANAGDTGSSPGLGRSRVPWSSWAHASQLLILHSGAHGSQLPRPTYLEPILCNKRGRCTERPVHCSEEWPCSPQLEEGWHAAVKTQHSQK